MHTTQGSITTRDELVRTLALAAELEHLLLCQYLFAAYSLKRSTAEGLTPVQLERVRRWGSAITLVARQEMEHLGLVMNLVNAIGGTPYLRRPNFPQKPGEFGTANLEQVLTPFSKPTIERFQYFEQPHPKPPPDWCSMGVEAARALRAERQSALRAERHALRATRDAVALTLEPAPMIYDSIQALYLAILDGFYTVAERVGERELFVGSPNQQVWGGRDSPYEGSMDDLNQYGLDLTQVGNLCTAEQAIWRILEQGEGLHAPPDYVPHTHYCLFSKILAEMAENPGIVAARPVVANPLVSMHPDITAPGEVNLITRAETRQVAVVANHTYQLMLEMLIFLYAVPNKTKEQTHGLTRAVFFPLMTMFVRPLAEVLTKLPAFSDRPGNAGPGFELPGALLMAPRLVDAGWLFQEKLDQLVIELESLSILDMKSDYSEVVQALTTMADDMQRLADDWRANWRNIGRDT